MQTSRPKKSSGKLAVTLQFILAGCLFMVYQACEIREIDPETGRAILDDQTARFSAEEFVDENWYDHVIPTVELNAIDIYYLLTLLETDSEAAAQYGHREGSRPYSYLVNGVADVAEVDTSSRVGMIKLGGFEDYGQSVNILIGPVISGTALRDALPFITFGQFINQLEFADVSREMHSLIQRTVLTEFNTEQADGRQIEFYGAFTNTGNEINITPVILDWAD